MQKKLIKLKQGKFTEKKIFFHEQCDFVNIAVYCCIKNMQNRNFRENIY